MTEKDEIAIIGVGCRFPGADNLAEYWRVLSNGENHVVEVPKDRWNVDAFYDPDPNAPRKTYARTAGFLKSIDEWDHKFYGINDMEASLIDPQQRLVLDCVHMALEDAGLTGRDVEGSPTGVYIGSTTCDYKGQVLDDTNVSSTYSVTGTNNSIISARVSYVYNLTGPAVTIDTACSSSLVAIDIASQAILSGNCEIAICGGVNVLLDPQLFVALSKARMLSPSGQCRTFTADADGYARGEGCGIVILKSLKKAKDDGNKVWGTIFTATNQDGRMASPITAPSGIRQEKLIEHIYNRFKVKKCNIQVIEAHGTGTPIGDPTETDALSAHFGKSSDAPLPVFIGSVKTNIGHLEAAAGVAGLIKVLLMLKNVTIVPSLWYSKANENPKLKLEDHGFVVPTEKIEWTRNAGQARMACVNSFGFGGTNAHAIVTEYSTPKNVFRASHLSVLPYILAVSAFDQNSLNENVNFVCRALKSQKYNLAELSWTSTCKRDHRPQRMAVFGSTQDALIESCTTFLDREVTSNSVTHSSDRTIIFVFCGVGTTWIGMCSQLMNIDQFRETVLEIDRYLKSLAGLTISDKFSENGDIHKDPLISHIAIFTCQVGLATLWETFGVKPDMVIGQSVGEVAAAHVAGYIDLKTAVRIIFLRSKLLASIQRGCMTVVKNVDTAIVDECCKRSSSASIAVYNSPVSCTLSGSEDGIKELKETIQQLENTSPQFVDLDVQCAYHSHFVEDASKDLGAQLNGISLQKGRIAFISTVTGKLESHVNLATAAYWQNNVRMPVLLSQAVQRSISETKLNILLEIGPSPVLHAHVRDILGKHENFTVLPSMMKQNERKCLTGTLCNLYSLGIDINWKTICPCENEMTDIPVYQFRKNRQFFQSEAVLLRNQGSDTSKVTHMFIKQLPSQNENAQFKVEIDGIATPFVFEHMVTGSVIVPGATYADVGFEVGHEMIGQSKNGLSVSLEFMRPVRADRGSKNSLHVSTIRQFKQTLFYVKHNQITVCKGWVREAIEDSIDRKRVDIESLKFTISKSGCRHVNIEEMYSSLESMGFRYGTCFRLMQHCVTNGIESVSLLEVPESVMKQVVSTTLHPCILDAMMQSTINAATPEIVSLIKEEKLNFLPVAIGNLFVLRKPEKRMYVFTKRIGTTILDTVFQVHYNMLLLNCDGIVIADLQNYTTYAKRKGCKAPCELNYHLTWQPCDIEPSPNEKSPRILALTDATDKDIHIELTGLENLQLYQTNSSKNRASFVEHAFCSYTQQDTQATIDAVLLIISNCGVFSEINENNAVQVHAAVRENCMLLTDVVRFMANSNVDAPLFIATQNTLPIFQTESSKVNLIGQELWGFVRSVRVEFIYNEITLIDLQPSLKETKETLFQFITSAFRNIQGTKPEVVIRKKKLFGAEFTKMARKEIMPTFRAERRPTLHKDSVHKVMAESSKKIQTVFLSEHTEKEETHEKAQTNMRIKSVCVHPLCVFPRTASGIQCDQDIWKESLNEGHVLYGLEYTAVRSCSQGNRRGSCKLLKNHQDAEDDVVALFPSEISTEMTIPKECTVSLKEVPFYQPGLVLFSMLCWKLIDRIPNRSSVVIFTRSSNTMTCDILRKMLQDRRSANVISSRVENQDTDRNKKQKIDVLLSLEKLDPSFIHIGRCKTILCLEDCLEEGVKTNMIRTGYQTIVCPNAKEILQPKNVSESMSDVVSWLRIFFQSVSSESAFTKPVVNQSDDEWAIPCRTVNVFEEIASLPPLRNSVRNIFKRSGIYIVTGGLTGLGWEFVRFIAEMGAGSIVSLSRRDISADKLEEIRNEEKRTGCKISCVRGDVTDLSSIRSVLSIIKSQTNGEEIKGVFHGAGVLKGRLLMNMEESILDEVLKPKVLGTLNMHIATEDLNLDFFVVSSSINSIIGTPGQNSYGAANSFMDTFMQWRRNQGKAGQAINWGALCVGMASRPEFVDNFKKRGFNLLSVFEIRSCFLEALMRNVTNIIYADINWDISARDYANPQQGRNRLQMKVLFEEATSSQITFENDGTDNMSFNVDSLKSASEERKRLVIRQILTKVVSKVIQGNIGQIKMTSSLEEMAFDSMSTVTFINIVQDITGHRIAQSFMLDSSRT